MRLRDHHPDKELYKGRPSSFPSPVWDGSMGFLDNHAPLITRVEGLVSVKVTMADGKVEPREGWRGGSDEEHSARTRRIGRRHASHVRRIKPWSRHGVKPAYRIRDDGLRKGPLAVQSNCPRPVQLVADIHRQMEPSKVMTDGSGSSTSGAPDHGPLVPRGIDWFSSLRAKNKWYIFAHRCDGSGHFDRFVHNFR